MAKWQLLGIFQPQNEISELKGLKNVCQRRRTYTDNLEGRNVKLSPGFNSVIRFRSEEDGLYVKERYSETLPGSKHRCVQHVGAPRGPSQRYILWKMPVVRQCACRSCRHSPTFAYTRLQYDCYLKIPRAVNSARRSRYDTLLAIKSFVPFPKSNIFWNPFISAGPPFIHYQLHKHATLSGSERLLMAGHPQKTM